MAGSIRSVITENRLEVTDVSDFWHSQGMRLGQQAKRARGQLPDGRFCTMYGASDREVVDRWLDAKRFWVSFEKGR